MKAAHYIRKYCAFIPAGDMELILGRNADDLYFSIKPAGISTADDAKETVRA